MQQPSEGKEKLAEVITIAMVAITLLIIFLKVLFF